MENKNSKYFKYAFGEIVLVVTGILIALQINNWSENRKSLSQEITILENIQEDILLDTLDISFNIDQHSDFIDAEKQLLHFLRGDRIEPQSTINYSAALGVPLMISLHDSTFNNIQNNQIGIISNNKVKKTISRFYDFYTEAIARLENEKLAYEPYPFKKVFFQKYFKLSEFSYELNDNQPKSVDFFSPTAIKVDLEFSDISGAKSDNAFKIELNESIFIRQLKIDFYLNMLRLIKELDEVIDKELSLLRN